MMRRIVSVAIAAALCQPAFAAAQKPLKEEPLWVSGTVAPANPAEMKAAADVVLLARYTGQHRLKEASGRPEPVATTHTFEVIEVLKGAGVALSATDTVDVEMLGGIVEHPTFTVSTRLQGQESLVPNRRYVLFLTPLPQRPGTVFRPTWGNAGEGVFDITGERVRPLSTTRRQQRGMSRTTFLEELRDAR
jgi:hypothetical protein